MGGDAFRKVAASDAPTLNVQRQTPSDHARLEALYIDRMQQFLGSGVEVVALIEAPEKQDHGDIDILIASTNPVNLIDLAKAIGARGFISGNPVICNLAVLQDGSRSSDPLVVYGKTGEASPDITAEAYVQIDIEVIAPTDLEWNRFYWSYGGVGGIIGMMVSALGFTMSSSRGLFLLLKEHGLVVDLKLGVAEKEATIMLSKSATEVMRFLGLSAEEYQRGFRTLREVCTWLGTCRVLSQETMKSVEYSESRERGNDKRSVYTAFKHEWVPANIPSILPVDSTDEARLTYVAKLRAQEEQAAVRFFQKHEQYTAIHAPLLCRIEVAAATHLLRPLVVQESGYELGNKKLTDVMRGIRRWVGARSEGIPYTLPAAVVEGEHSQLGGLLTESKRGLQDPEAVRRYVVQNWEELKRLGKK